MELKLEKTEKCPKVFIGPMRRSGSILWCIKCGSIQNEANPKPEEMIAPSVVEPLFGHGLYCADRKK
jgi:hypothetical protein